MTKNEFSFDKANAVTDEDTDNEDDGQVPKFS